MSYLQRVNDINNYVKDTFTSTSANNGSNSDENIKETFKKKISFDGFS